MILGLASPTYSGILPEQAPLLWLLDRCAEYDLKAMEAPLPLSGADHPKEVKEKAADLGVMWVGYWERGFRNAEREVESGCESGRSGRLTGPVLAG